MSISISLCACVKNKESQTLSGSIKEKLTQIMNLNVKTNIKFAGEKKKIRRKCLLDSTNEYKFIKHPYFNTSFF